MTEIAYGLASFGALLKAFRTRRHLTQQQLARAIGVHRSAIIRWEQGDFLPESKAVVLELARHLRLDDQETRQLLEASLTALAPHWSIPFPRNPFFTGRAAILELLHMQLGVTQTETCMPCAALQGLGGIGKTQIALEYAYRYALEYSAVFWIGAENAESMLSSFFHVAEILQLPERDSKDEQRVVTAVQRWLNTHSQWLLIWDNMEDLTLFDRFLPAAQTGAILLTTRFAICQPTEISSTPGIPPCCNSVERVRVSIRNRSPQRSLWPLWQLPSVIRRWEISYGSARFCNRMPSLKNSFSGEPRIWVRIFRRSARTNWSGIAS
jgi:transcriptional regulator with XRE-family HTH domain